MSSSKDWLKAKKLFLNFHLQVFRVVKSVINNKQDAEDITQETFIAFFLSCSMDDFENENQIKAWLFRTGTNKALNLLKRKSKTPLFADDYFQRLETSEPDNPEINVERNEAVKTIQKSLNMLPPDLKIIMVLYYYNEMPQKEIAQLIGIPLGTVKSRLNRARALMKESLHAKEVGAFDTGGKEVFFYE